MMVAGHSVFIASTAITPVALTLEVAHEFIEAACSVIAAILCLLLYRRADSIILPRGRVVLPFLAALFLFDSINDLVVGVYALLNRPTLVVMDLVGMLGGAGILVCLVWWLIKTAAKRAGAIKTLTAELEERKRAMSAALREGEQLRSEVLESSRALLNVGGELRRFEHLVMASRDAIIGINQDGTVWYANPAAEELFGWRAGEIVGCSIVAVRIVESGNLYNEIARLDSQLPQGGNSEVTATCAGGILRPLWISVSRLSQGSGGGGGWVLAARDLTEKRMVEDKISQSLFEKVILLREVHHRVKNNLQLICSLVRLQSKETSDPIALGMFRKSEERIRSLALVHEKLYRSGSLSRIPFGSYLQDLAHQLSRTCTTVASTVRVEASVEDLDVPIDSAITCGLIANELITNSIRHGAIPGKELLIRVGMRLREGRVVLTFGDNGPGSLTEELLRGSTSLGLSLVRTLTAQLHGETSLRIGDGIDITLSFPDAILRSKEPPPLQKVA